MKLTLNKWSALYVLRSLRANRERRSMLFCRTDIVPPDPAPMKRWGKGCFSKDAHPIIGQLYGQKLYVAVPSNETRVRTKGVSSTVYGSGIPEKSFIDVDGGIAISSPELLFVELANDLRPIEHLMLGHELCGSFGRDAADPRNGDVTYDIPPLTSVGRIEAFIQQTRSIRGIARARASLKLLSDNAWSPTESLIAAFMACRIDDMGYAFGRLVMNKRVFRNRDLPDAKGSRVPDVLVAGSSVGLNYDGLVHLDLESIARAGFELGLHPEKKQSEVALRRAISDVRAKVLDDTRRDRELSAGGYTVFPVLKEDLYQPGGLDQLIARVVDVLERQTTLDLSETKRALSAKPLSEDRYRLLRSLLPGSYEPDVKLHRYIAGHQVGEGNPEVVECWIEF